MHWIIIFLTIIYIPMIQSQTWAGTFLANPGCVLAACCCPSENIQVIETSSTTLALNLTLAGSLCMGMTTMYQPGLAKPEGFTISMTVSIVTFTVQLSSDSNTITVSSTLGSSCTVVSTRVGTIAASTTQGANVVQTTSRTGAAQKYVAPSVLFYLSFVCLVMNN